jgi:hypothetical protein
VREDVKLMGQASHERIGFILTEDKNTLFRYCERLCTAGKIQIRAITLEDGFDIDAFREDGRRSLDFGDVTDS